MSNVESMGKTMLEQKRRWKDRLLLEIMEQLFRELPDKTRIFDDGGKDKESIEPSFILKDGTKCYLMKFSPPKSTEDNPDIRYGFDIVLGNHPHLDHLEFYVECTGFGGNC